MALSVLLDKVQAHLAELGHDPSQAVDEKLLEQIDRQIAESIQESQRDGLLNQLSAVLPTLQQDPTPVTNLIQTLISSSHKYNFSRALSITPPVDFFAGLTSQIPPINLVVLALLEKAKNRVGDVGIVAGKPEVVGALIKLWLCTPDTAVAARADEVIRALLVFDLHDPPAVYAHRLTHEGLMWRRIFRDKAIYGSIFSICSLSTAGQDGQLSKRDKTVAQARLLDMLIWIDGQQVRSPCFEDIEKSHGVKAGGGLLHFAAISMVDYQEDVLMHITLIDFYANLLMHLTAVDSYAKCIRRKRTATSSCEDEAPDYSVPPVDPLRFLRENGLHERTLKYYLCPNEQDSLDLTFLLGPSANYLATYCHFYPQDFLRHRNLVDSTLNRIHENLQAVSPGQWAQGQVPKHDFNILASIPRATLFSKNQESPLFLIPAKSGDPSTFETLAEIFHGVDKSKTVFPEKALSENPAARALYFLYMERYPTFWTQIVSAAETVAMKEIAVAAISVIGAIITAQWAPLSSNLPGSSAFDVPTEETLTEKCHTDGIQLPQSGIETIMSEPAIGVVVPYLMRPAQTFSNLVGGGRGDVDSAAYRVAVAKHDVLTLLNQKLKEWVGTHSDAGEMVATVSRRVAQGPMGGTSEIGGRVGTLDL